MAEKVSKVRLQGRISAHKRVIERKRERLEATYFFGAQPIKRPVPTGPFETFSIGPPSKRSNVEKRWEYCGPCDREEPPFMKHCFKCNRCTSSLRFHCAGKDCMVFINGTETHCQYGHPVCTADICL